MLTFRRRRTDELPHDLFAEPGWDMLLDLFVADAQGRRLTGRDLARNCGARISAATRWLLYLNKSGLVIGDGKGDLDDVLSLSGSGMAHMEQLLAHARRLKDAL